VQGRYAEIGELPKIVRETPMVKTVVLDMFKAVD